MDSRNTKQGKRRTSPVVLAMHAVAMSLFAITLSGAAGSAGRILILSGFGIVAASFAVGRRLDRQPPTPAAQALVAVPTRIVTPEPVELRRAA